MNPFAQIWICLMLVFIASALTDISTALVLLR